MITDKELWSLAENETGSGANAAMIGNGLQMIVLLAYLTLSR